MLAAITLAAPMALITEAGPVAQSPPAKTPGIFTKPPNFSATIWPFTTGIPASSKCWYSIS